MRHMNDNRQPVIGRGWMQEWHCTMERTVSSRAKVLRKVGLVVHVSSSVQVTEVGRIKMSLLDARTPDAQDFNDEQLDAIAGGQS